jgi:hypothetical protein
LPDRHGLPRSTDYKALAIVIADGVDDPCAEYRIYEVALKQ